MMVQPDESEVLVGVKFRGFAGGRGVGWNLRGLCRAGTRSSLELPGSRLEMGSKAERQVWGDKPSALLGCSGTPWRNTRLMMKLTAGPLRSRGFEVRRLYLNWRQTAL